MSTNEFTKEDLIDWLRKNSVDNKVSVQDVADLVADARFPQDLVQNAVKELAAERDDRNRHKEVTDKLSSGLGSLEDLRKRTAQMRADLDAAEKETRQLEHTLAPLWRELEEIQGRMAERQGRHSGNAGK